MKRKSILSALVALAVISAGAGTALYRAGAAEAEKGKEAPAAATPAAPETVAVPQFGISVNGHMLQLDEPAHMLGNTMLVPLRNIAEALEAQVDYDDKTGLVTAVKGDLRVEFQLGTDEASRNGSLLKLAAPAIRIGDSAMVPLRFFSEAFETAVKWDGQNKLVTVDHESYLLPAVESLDNLKELLKQQTDTYIAFSGDESGVARITADATSSTADQAAAAPQREAAKAEEAKDYSGTNVQVEGVDEADVVKTDGEFIYQVSGNRIHIARAYPAEEMALEATIDLTDSKLNPIELFVDNDRLIVIGTSYEHIDNAVPVNKIAVPEAKRLIAPALQSSVKTIIYDIADRKNPQALKEVETEGSYVSSRKIGSQVYVIANRYLDRYGILNEDAEPDGPAYRDSSVSGQWIKMPYEDIRYFPDSNLTSYMVIAGLDVLNPEKPSQISVYLGSAQNVYASAGSLYITHSHNQLNPIIVRPAKDETAAAVKEQAVVESQEASVIYKFLLEDGKARFAAKGQVPGTVLNQFSMDEANGYFRIATTKGDVWRTGEGTSKNNLYILDESMNITGLIEDIAPGERIYSVRFMGGRGYMVTFKKVDPLFVLDLSNPHSPSILGKLKIPGYSDYLHPYDENHLIGFGKDAVEVSNESLGSGQSSSTTAYYQGMKVSMFDVTDVSQPKELFQTVIGDRGTDSELLSNHKALLFSKEKNLLAFPVTVAEVPSSAKDQAGASTYGQFVFQGAYVYQIDLQEGFKLRGKITHLSEDEQLKAGGYWYGGPNNIQRVLYIGDTLYTLSSGQIRANLLDSLEEKNRLALP